MGMRRDLSGSNVLALEFSPPILYIVLFDFRFT